MGLGLWSFLSVFPPLTHPRPPNIVRTPMGLLDSLLSGGDKLQIATSLITKHSSGNGLAGLAQQFDQQGLGQLMQSWIGTGENRPISPDQMNQVLGREQVEQLAQQHGMQGSELSGALAKMLPQLVDKLTPKGQVPPSNDLQGMLAGLLGSLGK